MHVEKSGIEYRRRFHRDTNSAIDLANSGCELPAKRTNGTLAPRGSIVDISNVWTYDFMRVMFCQQQWRIQFVSMDGSK